MAKTFLTPEQSRQNERSYHLSRGNISPFFRLQESPDDELDEDIEFGDNPHVATSTFGLQQDTNLPINGVRPGTSESFSTSQSSTDYAKEERSVVTLSLLALAGLVDLWRMSSEMDDDEHITSAPQLPTQAFLMGVAGMLAVSHCFCSTLGKTVENAFSMELDRQRPWLERVDWARLEGSQQERKQVLLEALCRTPQAEACITLMDTSHRESLLDFMLAQFDGHFLATITERGQDIAALFGNHPNTERIDYAIYGWWTPLELLPSKFPHIFQKQSPEFIADLREAMLRDALGPDISDHELKRIVDYLVNTPCSTLYATADKIDSAIGDDVTSENIELAVNSWISKWTDIGPTARIDKSPYGWFPYAKFLLDSGWAGTALQMSSGYLKTVNQTKPVENSTTSDTSLPEQGTNSPGIVEAINRFHETALSTRNATALPAPLFRKHNSITTNGMPVSVSTTPSVSSPGQDTQPGWLPWLTGLLASAWQAVPADALDEVVPENTPSHAAALLGGALRAPRIPAGSRYRPSGMKALAALGTGAATTAVWWLWPKEKSSNTSSEAATLPDNNTVMSAPQLANTTLPLADHSNSTLTLGGVTVDSSTTDHQNFSDTTIVDAIVDKDWYFLEEFASDREIFKTDLYDVLKKRGMSEDTEANSLMLEIAIEQAIESLSAESDLEHKTIKKIQKRDADWPSAPDKLLAAVDARLASIQKKSITQAFIVNGGRLATNSETPSIVLLKCDPKNPAEFIQPGTWDTRPSTFPLELRHTEDIVVFEDETLCSRVVISIDGEPLSDANLSQEKRLVYFRTPDSGTSNHGIFSPNRYLSRSVYDKPQWYQSNSYARMGFIYTNKERSGQVEISGYSSRSRPVAKRINGAIYVAASHKSSGCLKDIVSTCTDHPMAPDHFYVSKFKKSGEHKIILFSRASKLVIDKWPSDKNIEIVYEKEVKGQDPYYGSFRPILSTIWDEKMSLNSTGIEFVMRDISKEEKELVLTSRLDSSIISFRGPTKIIDDTFASMKEELALSLNPECANVDAPVSKERENNCMAKIWNNNRRVVQTFPISDPSGRSNRVLTIPQNPEFDQLTAVLYNLQDRPVLPAEMAGNLTLRFPPLPETQQAFLGRTLRSGEAISQRSLDISHVRSIYAEGFTPPLIREQQVDERTGENKTEFANPETGLRIAFDGDTESIKVGIEDIWRQINALHESDYRAFQQDGRRYFNGHPQIPLEINTRDFRSLQHKKLRPTAENATIIISSKPSSDIDIEIGDIPMQGKVVADNQDIPAFRAVRQTDNLARGREKIVIQYPSSKIKIEISGSREAISATATSMHGQMKQAEDRFAEQISHWQSRLNSSDAALDDFRILNRQRASTSPFACQLADRLALQQGDQAFATYLPPNFEVPDSRQEIPASEFDRRGEQLQPFIGSPQKNLEPQENYTAALHGAIRNTLDTLEVHRHTFGFAYKNISESNWNACYQEYQHALNSSQEQETHNIPLLLKAYQKYQQIGDTRDRLERYSTTIAQNDKETENENSIHDLSEDWNALSDKTRRRANQFARQCGEKTFEEAMTDINIESISSSNSSDIASMTTRVKQALEAELDDLQHDGKLNALPDDVWKNRSLATEGENINAWSNRIYHDFQNRTEKIATAFEPLFQLLNVTTTINDLGEVEFKDKKSHLEKQLQYVEFSNVTISAIKDDEEDSSWKDDAALWGTGIGATIVLLGVGGGISGMLSEAAAAGTIVLGAGVGAGAVLPILIDHITFVPAATFAGNVGIAQSYLFRYMSAKGWLTNPKILIGVATLECGFVVLLVTAGVEQTGTDFHTMIEKPSLKNVLIEAGDVVVTVGTVLGAAAPCLEMVAGAPELLGISGVLSAIDASVDALGVEQEGLAPLAQSEPEPEDLFTYSEQAQLMTTRIKNAAPVDKMGMAGAGTIVVGWALNAVGTKMPKEKKIDPSQEDLRLGRLLNG